ncbi:MAG: recombinase A [Candidatus Dadabacteria bacterium]|nr:MAG: recombinase A [Candidatus Dadabacteria bacterium]
MTSRHEVGRIDESRLPGARAARIAQLRQTVAAVPLANRKSAAEVASWTHLQGRLVELTSATGRGQLTAAAFIVLQAQLRGEPVCWISTTRDTWFAPDLAEWGIDLAALPTLFVDDGTAAGRAADLAVRDGGFGLVVLDLTAGGYLAQARLQRLSRQARQHQAVVLCLTRQRQEQPVCHSGVSLRLQTQSRPLSALRWQCRLEVKYDRFGVAGRSRILLCRPQEAASDAV